MNRQYSIFAVVVSYNGMRNNWINNCMVSLANSTYPVKVIVVDNDSSDNTCNFIRMSFPDVLVFHQNANLGFGRANNIGIRYAISQNADYILLLNQDATIAENCIEILLSESNGQSLLSPVHCNGQGDKLDKMFCFTFNNIDKSFYDDILINGKFNEKYKVGEIPAACWFIPVDIVKRIGGFNPLFHQYGEDNNFCHRLMYHNVQVFLVPKARMYHDRKLFGDINVFNKKWLKRNLLLASCNINNNLGRILLLLVRDLYRCYTVELKKQNYKPGDFLFSVLWILVHLHSIIHSRKIERNNLGSWLNE